MQLKVSPEPPPPKVDVPYIEDLLLTDGYTSAIDKVRWLNVSKEQIEQVAQLTNGQTSNHLRSMVKKNRLTASNFGVVLSAIRRQRFPP